MKDRLKNSKYKITRGIFLTLLGVITLPMATVGTIQYLDHINFFAITDVQIQIKNSAEMDLKYLTSKTTKLETFLAQFKSQSLIKLDLKKLSSYMETLDWIEDYSILRQIPNRIIISLKAREPLLLIQARGNKLVPVDKEGHLLEPVATQNAPDEIIAVGDDFLNKPDLRKKALLFLNILPHSGTFSRKSIAEIKFDTQTGFWATLMRSNTKIKLGDDELEVKAKRVSQVLDYLDQHQIKARVIDANLSKKVLVRLHKGP